MKMELDEHLHGNTEQRVSFTVTGATIEDLHVRAHKALTGLIPDRPFGIDRFLISPAVRNDRDEIMVWEAEVEAHVAPMGPVDQ